MNYLHRLFNTVLLVLAMPFIAIFLLICSLFGQRWELKPKFKSRDDNPNPFDFGGEVIHDAWNQQEESKQEKAVINIGPVHIDTDSDPVQVKIILAVAVVVLCIFMGIMGIIGEKLGYITFHWSKTIEQPK